jgi:peptide/nickel transport system substrate-binding protein
LSGQFANNTIAVRILSIASVVLGLGACLCPASVDAATLRWSGAGDVVTLDPHSTPDAYSDGVLHNVYECLLARDKNYQLVPALAVSWTTLSPTRTRLVLRSGVLFHDGTSFTADDVVFSLTRLGRPASIHREAVVGISEVVRVDALTVDVVTALPLPTLLPQLAYASIMSKSWLLKNGSGEPHDYAAGKESYSARHANGTGPYAVKQHETGTRLVLVANPRWWGRREGNITEATLLPIKSSATRMAALLSGETDLVIDPPPQDLDRLGSNAQLKIIKGAENRVLYLSFDLARDRLLFSSVTDRNPFKDRRVREAVALAIDTGALQKKVMRGLSIPTGTLVPSGATGYSAKAGLPLATNLPRARQLLAEAGYPNGFSVTLDCSNDRYVLDEQLCVALAGMISRTGIQVTANPRPKAIFFQKTDVANRETSLFMIGMGAITADAMMPLDSMLHSTIGNLGGNNTSGIASPKLDALLDAARIELDPGKRNALLEETQMLVRQEFWTIPLHQQIAPWVMRRNIDVVHRPDNYLDLRWVNVGAP